VGGGCYAQKKSVIRFMWTEHEQVPTPCGYVDMSYQKHSTN